MLRNWGAWIFGPVLASAVFILADNLINDRWANQARLRAHPEQVQILKNALSPAQRARYERCELTTPCQPIRGLDAQLKCQNNYMRGCMFQPLEKAK